MLDNLPGCMSQKGRCVRLKITGDIILDTQEEIRPETTKKDDNFSAELVDLYSKAANPLIGICRKWAEGGHSGCIAWVVQRRPDLGKRIAIIEAAANEAWLDCEEGVGNVEAVKALLSEWYKAYRQAFIAYDEYLNKCD
jgi:hypothetical protein